MVRMYGCFHETPVECSVDDVIVPHAKYRNFPRTGACAYFSSVGLFLALDLVVKNYQGHENPHPWQLPELSVGCGVADR